MYLGTEIGGTKLQLGVGFGESSPIERLERRNIDRQQGAAGILNQIKQAGSELAAAYDVEAIGIGFGGPIDAASGRVITSHQVAGWDNFPLRDWCQDEFNLPTVLGNDCDTAALAEATLGAGRGKRTVFYVTVGTGIGGGLVINGQLHGSGRPAVAEIGHLRPGGFNEMTSKNTVESISAGPGIEAAVKAVLCEGKDTEAAALIEAAAGDIESLTAVNIADAARSGNSIATAAIQRAVECLGWAIAQTVTLTAADIVIVGGGVSLMGDDLFFAPLRQATRRHVFGPLADAFEIVPAALGEEVVVHGAIRLASIASASGERPA